MSGGGYYQFSFGEGGNTGLAGGSGGSGKLPLSKSFPGSHDHHSSRQRVQHACEPCRRKKSRCDGARPTCKTCQTTSRECYYGEGKREKTKKRLNEYHQLEKQYQQLEKQNRNNEDIIRDLLAHASLDEQTKKNIELSLKENSRRPSALPRTSSPSTSSSAPTRHYHSSKGKKAASVSAYESDSNSSEDGYYVEEDARGHPGAAEVGHLGKTFEFGTTSTTMDRVMDDINTTHVNIPSGFMGKISDVSWISFLYHYLEHGYAALDIQYDHSGHPIGPDMPVYMNMEQSRVGSYYVDDQDISVGGSPVNHFAIPPRLVADRLTASFFESVQPLCPIVERQEFNKEYERLYQDGNAQLRPWCWLAMLNLIFALGQTFEDLSHTVNIQDCTTHVEYFTRARILGALDGGLVFRVGTLIQVQVMGLASLYLLATKQANRAWNANGLAIRLAHGLGLHIRNETNTLSLLKREMRNRTWYCLVYLESLLAMVTGRPSCLRISDCNAPVPQSIKDELSSIYPQQDAPPDPYFSAVMRMNTIFEGVCSDLYSSISGADKCNWRTLRKVIEEYLRKVEDWKEGLPAELDFDKTDYIDECCRQRNDLFLRYAHTKMVILRPTLCHEITLQRQPPDMRSFIINHAAICVTHAVLNIQKLANPPLTITKRLSTIPWWCFLYYLTSSEAIILTEVVFQTSGMKTANDQEIERFLNVARDGFKWLFSISDANLAGRRCCAMLARIFRMLAKRLGRYSEMLEKEFADAIERDIIEGIDQPSLEEWVSHGPLDFRNRYPMG